MVKSSVLRCCLKALPFLLILLYILAVVVPYIEHKEVSPEYRAAFEDRRFYGTGVGPERAAYIDNNKDALFCRMNLIGNAEEEIILSTFDFNGDSSGTDMVSALFCAAERGVQVRVLVDGASGFLDVKKDPVFKALAGHKNVELKIYNPIDLLQPWKLQARLHDKYLIVDRKVYLLGGRNTTDLFLGEQPSVKPNIDRELLVMRSGQDPEASLYQLVNYFESVWALPDSRLFQGRLGEEDRQREEESLRSRERAMRAAEPELFVSVDWRERTFETGRISLLTNPIQAENKEPWMWYSLNRLMSQGKQVIVYTPYIICGREMYHDLERLTSEGTEIQIITNDVASGANPWGCTDYLNQRRKIWDTGVQVYEYMGEHSCHTKAMVIDDRLSVVGSYNMDMRSTYQDTELMLVVDSPKLNRMIREEAEHDQTYSKTMGEDGEYQYGEKYVPKELSFGKKAFYLVLRVLTIPLRRFL